MFNPIDEKVAKVIRNWLGSGEAVQEEKPDLTKNIYTPETPKKEETKTETHTQKELIEWAKVNYNVSAKEIGPALVVAGITGFEIDHWDVMQNVIKSFAMKRDLTDHGEVGSVSVGGDYTDAVS